MAQAVAQDELEHPSSENGLRDPMTPTSTKEMPNYVSGPYSNHINVASKRAGIDAIRANREAQVFNTVANNNRQKESMHASLCKSPFQ